MKKFLPAAVLALAMAAIGQQQASAAGGCFHLKICYSFSCKCWCEPCAPCCGSGYGGGGGGGYEGGCCGPGSCPPTVPGPWYAYWPYDGRSQIGGGFGNWEYSNHFQTPAPTGYPCAPLPMVAGAGAGSTPDYGAGFVPASYSGHPPAYWYGW
jgi:hypothetical protein